ncbi:MAG: decaprenyl-phosphate phosphoribosyltransferase [Sedimentisphaerales bacterium]|nr:decaprenyl-phosphate phosphoribosyltransferase [Sedimentisphaerales bacterium]
MELIRLLRPVHWVKNAFVFAALIFGKQFLGPVNEVLLAVAQAVGAFFCFSFAASSMYVVNDIADRRADSIHPERRDRPIAAGRVSVATAAQVAVGCALLALIGSHVLAPALAAIVATYMVLTLLYSFLLKRVMILDCVIIAVGFCLRAVAGAVAVDVFISPWLVICTFALCLFLAFSKRRGEIAQLQASSEAFRKTLGEYTPELLAHMLDVSSVLAVVCFLLYAMDDRTQAIFGTNQLVYTTPVVLYCIFRFSALTQKGVYSDPVKLILRDRPFQIGILIWVVLCVGIIYGNGTGFQA